MLRQESEITTSDCLETINVSVRKQQRKYHMIQRLRNKIEATRYYVPKQTKFDVVTFHKLDSWWNWQPASY